VSNKPRVYKTEALILRRSELGEADRLLVLFTPQFGKVRAIAKGARRPQSRKAGHLEPFTQVQLMLAQGRELDIITQAEAVNTFAELRADLSLLGQAAYVAELIDRFSVEDTENQALYRLAINTLDRLKTGKFPAGSIFYFNMRFLDLVGYRPELFRCVRCGEDIRPTDQFFSFQDGGVVCPTCGGKMKDSTPISLSALKVLRHFQRNTYAAVSSLDISHKVMRELEQILEGYLTYLLERRLNVPTFLREIRSVEYDSG
jgi:DNA repair protein RecO (recombination protein O)